MITMGILNGIEELFVLQNRIVQENTVHTKLQTRKNCLKMLSTRFLIEILTPHVDVGNRSSSIGLNKKSKS